MPLAPTNINTMSSQNPTSNMLRMQEEIKRLQQLQRLRAATAACSFPSAGSGGGLLPSSSTSNNNTSGMGLSNDPTLVGSAVNMNNRNLNNNNNNVMNMSNMSCIGSAAASAGAGTGASNPMFALMKQQQQQQQQQQQKQEETRLMLLQHQFLLNNPGTTGTGSGATTASAATLQQQQLQQQLLAGNRNANLFSDLSLPTPSALAQQQQQLQLKQQLQQVQQQHGLQQQPSDLLGVRPLMRVGAIEPFPEKLHRMLMEVEQCGRGDVISFINNGRGFAIHKPDTFFKEIVPLYFRHSRLSSFKRQLNLYGFEQINIGPFRGGYYHEMFHRDLPERCRRMRRVAVKVSGATTQRKKEQAEAAARAKAEAESKKTEQEGQEDNGEHQD